MKIAIVGNGIIGLSVARELKKIDKSNVIFVFGYQNRVGAGSMAAAAMLNSFAEIEANYLNHEINQKRFRQSQIATSLWPQVLSSLEDETGMKISSGLGTYVISDNRQGSLESENFEAIAEALNRFEEPHTFVDLKDLFGYRPAIEGSAARALYIEREGWVDVAPTINAFEKSLLRQDVKFVDQEIVNIVSNKDSGSVRLLDVSGESHEFDKVLFAAGAKTRNFIHHLGGTDNNPYLLFGVGNTIRLKVNDLKQRQVIRTPNRGLACGLYSAPYLQDELVIGATNYVTDEAKTFPGVEEVHSLLSMAQRELNSELAFAEIKNISTGWRPISSDGVPIIGKTALKNTYICSGTRRDGWHLSSYLSELVAELIYQDETPEELEIYRMNRVPYRFISVKQSIDMCTRHYINGMLQHGLQLPRGGYNKHIQRNYELFFTKLHEDLGLTEYGIPVELVGFVASKLNQGVRVQI
jgi:glycine/D-amino acid oxidase-like deaminating enzyme